MVKHLLFTVKKTGIDKAHIYNFSLVLIPVCIVYARAYYVIFKWDNYKDMNFILLIVTLWAYVHFKRKGHLLPFYMVGYGAIRFFVEGLRTDSLYIVPDLRVSQLLSLVLIICGLLLVSYIKKSQKVRKVANNEQ